MLLSRMVSGLRGPRQRILGSEFAGEVEAVGFAVRKASGADWSSM
jgi:NADPH:quinone reductase-like Zn-dependent oxidoreductase